MDYKSPKDEQEEIVTFRPAFKPKKLPREEPPTERKDLSYDIERNIKGRLLRAKSSSVPRYRGEASIPRRSSVVPTQRRPPQRRPLRRVVKAGHQSSEIPNYKKGLGELEDITGQLKKLQKTKNSDTNWQKSYGYEDRAYGSTEGDIGGSMNRAYGFAKKGYGFENRPKEPVEVEIDISPVARSPPNEEHRLTRRYNPTRVRPRKSPNEKQDSRELIARIRESVRDDLHGRAMIPDSSARREESRPTTRDRSEDKKFPYEATRFPSLEKTYGYDDKGFGFTNSENRNEKQGFGFTRQSYGVDNKDEPVREPKRSRYFDRRRNFIDGRHNQGIRKTYQRRAGPGKRRRDG